MKLKVEAIKLSERLGLIQGIAERRATMPVLSQVLVSASKDKLELAVTDLETTMSAWCSAIVSKEGSLAIPARKLYEIVKELPMGEVEIEGIGNHWVQLKTPSATFKIAGLPSEDFPAVPELSPENLFSVESSLVDDMINKTIFAVSPDDLRRNLAGIYFQKTGKHNLRFVATDGHRLSLAERDVKSEVRLSRGVVVPKKGVAELRKIVKLSENINIGFGKNFFMAESDGAVLIVRLIDAEFPDYNQVIPEVTKSSFQVKQGEFLSAIRRVSTLSSDKTKSIKLTINKGEMTLLSVSPEIGEAKEVVPIEYSGDSVDLGFNARYLMEVLEVIGEESVQLGVSDELSPAVIKPVGEGVYISVIM
ncbi:MAG: DNA polymerase III subunit beta, partial [Thermodesulfobacteriota bacterium]